MKKQAVLAVVGCALGVSAPFADAEVVFSQPPDPSFLFSWISNQSDRIVAPFVAAQTRPMTGLCFWARNSSSVFDSSEDIRVDLYAEAPGGGVGASLFSSVVPFASFSEEPTSSSVTSKFGFSLPAAIPLTQGTRYFLGLSGDEFVTDADPFHGLAWVEAPAGEPVWVSFGGADFQEVSDIRVSFEIKSEVIPLPSAAMMGFAGLGVLARSRRRRA